MSTIVRRHINSAGLPGGGLAKTVSRQSGTKHLTRSGTEIVSGGSKTGSAAGTKHAARVLAWDAAEK